MKKIIANVIVEPDVSEEKYLPAIEKLCGTYPMDSDYRILLGKKPAGGVPALKAEVGDDWSNLEYVFGVNKIVVREGIWPFTPTRVMRYKPSAHVHASEANDEIGIREHQIINFDTRIKVLGKYEREELRRKVFRERAEIGHYSNPRQEHLSRCLGDYMGSGENRYKCFQR